MKVRALIFLLFILYALGSVQAQECNVPVLTNPLNGATDVPVDTTISWDPVVGVPGYIISLGTTPGGTDIVNEKNVGSAVSFKPPLGLPENTQIYVTITLFFFQGGIPDIICQSESFVTEDVTSPPPCTQLSNPLNAATNINVVSNITWENAPTATGYFLSLGTSPGATDILANQDVGNVLTYNPPVDFPATTQIYVQVTPYNENGNLAPCVEESFTTGALATLPGCTSLISPLNGAINVPLTPFLEWNPVAGATGYRVSIGSSPFTAEILDNVIFNNNSTFVLNFEENRTFFVTITPFNAAGDALSCTQESFSTILGCGPFFDPLSGELITLNPEINIQDFYSFCEGEAPITVSTTDTAEGFRWFRVDQSGNETLISENSSVDIDVMGMYRYEAYNTVVQSSGTLECPTSKIFEVLSSEIATITNLDVSIQATGVQIVVNATGIGDYEYALDNISGPYQDSNTFTGVMAGLHTAYVRDKNGCGIVQESVEQDLTLEGFPKFFTPNGDGINDFWQFIPPPLTGINNLEVIHIFDRYGSLLAQIDPSSAGWDGNFKGRPLPASDYWFRAIDNSNKVINGHFSLKR